MSDSLIRRGYADSAHGQIHYRVAGSASLTPLVLLHQTPSDGASLEAVMTLLAPQFRVYAPDLPGMGQSAACPSPDSIALYAKMLSEAMASLGVPQYHLFGHHTGAGVAIQMAVDTPERILKLALSGPPLMSDEKRKALPTMVPPIPRRADGGHLTEMWARIQKKAPDNHLALVEREVLLAIGMGERYQAAYRAVAAQPVAEQLGLIRAETLVFAGDNDSLIGTLDDAHALLQNGHKAIVPDGDTYISDLLPQQLADLLRSFFSSPQ